MGFEPLDGIKLVLLMAAGLIFCIAGLYLLIRPKPEGSAAKIEIFGLKFESSSAGLLVFLIGAAFLAVPMFVPEKEIVADPVDVPGVTPAPVPEPKDEAKAQEDPDAPRVGLVGTSGRKVPEVEPNDRVETATPLRIGEIGTGHTGERDDVDWFVVPIPQGAIKGHEVKLKHFTRTGGQMTAQVFNRREENMGFINARNGAVYLKIKSDFDDRIYFRLQGSDSSESGYEISLVPGTAD